MKHTHLAESRGARMPGAVRLTFLLLASTAGLPAAPTITSVDPPAGVPLQEGRTVPLRLSGAGLTPDLSPSVVDLNGDPVPGMTVSHYLVQDGSAGPFTNAGLLLKIPVIVTLSAGQTRLYELRLAGPLGSPATAQFLVEGLDELSVPAGQRLNFNDPTNAPPRTYSSVTLQPGSVLRVEGGQLDLQVTGPVVIDGLVDATGAAGANATGGVGGTAGGSGGAGGNGAPPGGGSTAGADGWPAVPALSAYVYPRGFGGAAGIYTGDSVTALASPGCGVGDLDPCADAIRLMLQHDPTDPFHVFEDHYIAGKTGWGGTRSVGDHPHRGGGGGGGGGGAGIPGSPGFHGGGAGAGGEGGAGVRIVAREPIRVGNAGFVHADGGPGGDGTRAGFAGPLTDDATLEDMVLSGGGGGGGGGAELIVFSADTGPSFERRWYSVLGGKTGNGGFYLNRFSEPNGGERSSRGFERLRGIAGQARVAGPPFRRAILSDAVVDRNVVFLREDNPEGPAPTEFEVRGEQPGQVRRICVGGQNDPGLTGYRVWNPHDSRPPIVPPLKPPYVANLILFPGFNTIVVRAQDDDESPDAPAYDLLFPRILCLSGTDSDGDGLSDADELDIGLDPHNPNTDLDGESDADDIACDPDLVLNGRIRFVAGNGPAPGSSQLFEEGVPTLETHLYNPSHLAFGPDGSLYVKETSNPGYRIRRITPDGLIRTVAGGGPNTGPSYGDGGPATNAFLSPQATSDFVVASDGSLYLLDLFAGENGYRVRRVTLNGLIETVAGGGTNQFLIGVNAARSIELRPSAGDSDIAIAPDGTIYLTHGIPGHPVNFMSGGGGGISILDPANGTLSYFAGGGTNVAVTPDTYAEVRPREMIFEPDAIAVGPDGSLVVAMQAPAQIMRVFNDGGTLKFRRLTGAPTNSVLALADGQLASEFKIGRADELAVGADGSVYYSELNVSGPGNARIGIVRISPGGVRRVLYGFGSGAGALINGQQARFGATIYPLDLDLSPDNRVHFVAGPFGRVARIVYLGDPDLPYGRPPTIAFEQAVLVVPENSPQFSLSVGRSHALGPVQASLALSRVSTSPGDHGMPFSALSFDANSRRVSAYMGIWDDFEAEGTEIVELTLSNPSGPGFTSDPTIQAVIGGPQKQTIYIIDDEQPPVFQVRFQSPTLSVNEGAGPVELAVERVGQMAGTFSIDYQVLPGNATPGSDFVLAAGTLNFADNDPEQSMLLTILDDAEPERAETLRVVLTNPTNGAAPDNPADALITILDNELPPPGPSQFQFTASPSLFVSEASGTVLIGVRRVGDTSQAATLSYAVAAGATALPGSDFIPPGGQLDFQPNETDKQFELVILEDGTPEADEVVALTLIPPLGSGVTVGRDLQVTIGDNDQNPAVPPPTSEWRLVALTGDPAAGVPGASFAAFESAVINEDGAAAFRATLSGSAGEGIWLAPRGGPLTLVTHTGDSVPLLPGATFVSFSHPILNDAGAVAFVGQTTQGRGIWTGFPGTLSARAREGEPSSTYLGGIGSISQRFYFNSGAAVAYFGTLLQGGRHHGAFFLDRGAMIAADLPEPFLAPSLPVPPQVYGAYYAGLGPQGMLTLTGVLQPGIGGVTPANQYLVWHGDQFPLRIAFRDGSAWFVAWNGVGQNGVSVLESGGFVVSHAQGLWYSNARRHLVDRTESVPGLPGVQFASFERFAAMRRDAVAFIAKLVPGQGGVIMGVNDIGLWRKDLGEIAPLARTGQAAPGAGPGVTWTGFEELTELNAYGDPAETAFYANTSDGRRGVWALNQCGLVEKIVLPGDVIEVAPGDSRTVAQVIAFTLDGIDALPPTTNGQDGQPKWLNGRGEIPIAVSFTDGSQAILLRSLRSTGCIRTSRFLVRAIAENASEPLDIPLLRYGPTAAAQTVTVTVTGGTASLNTHFTLDRTQVVFGAGDTEQTLLLTPIDNFDLGDRTVELTFADGLSGATSTLEVTIVDDDTPPIHPVLLPPIRLARDVLALDFQGLAGRWYEVQASSDLRTWVPVERTAVRAGPAASVYVPVPHNRSMRFFRVLEVTAH